MKAPNNLILIGMPASGKSTVGVLAAKGLGFDFIDTDLLLQKQEGKKLHEILARNGNQRFLDAENHLLAGLSVSQSVVSTGGSAVYHARGMAHLKSLGTVVWLDVSFGEIERRLGDMVSRGVVLKPGQTLRNLFDERFPLYESWADLRLPVGQEPLEITANRLLALVL